MGKCCWSGRKERAGRKAGPSLGSFSIMPGSPPARKVMRRESLFGDCQACSPIVREISRLFTDRLTGDDEYLPRHGPSQSVIVATEAMAGEVQHDGDQQKHTDNGVEYL